MGAEASNSSLDRFEAFANEFARSHLEDYIATLPTRRTPQQKEFNDPVWGTIVARSHEVMVVDSPLFQRLQRIRQLGVAHLLYRSANHTRFEHSLGALHAMEVLIDALRSARVAGDEAVMAITATGETTLRLAALLHDLGHPVMSHVGENAVRYTPWARALEREASGAIDGVEEPKPSELMSYCARPAADQTTGRRTRLR